MFSLPPLPPWNGLHPLIVHFPIALVMVTPVFVVLALFRRKHTPEWVGVSALLMLMAAGGAWLATSTGSAAEDFAKQVPGAKAILEEHEELGEAAQSFAIGLAAALVVWSGGMWIWGEKVRRKVVVGAGILYLVGHAAGMLVVANAAHQGGRLVHEVGVRARLSGEVPQGQPSVQKESDDKDD